MLCVSSGIQTLEKRKNIDRENLKGEGGGGGPGHNLIVLDINIFFQRPKYHNFYTKGLGLQKQRIKEK
jgi:hypothetical protein